MIEHVWLLHLAAFGGAFLQSASGIGFGVIAGPVILIAMNDGAAIQVSILLSFLIAALLTPSLYKAADRVLLKPLVAATLFGAPLGILVFLAIEVALLKVLAGLAVAFMAAAASGVLPLRKRQGASHWSIGAGAISGAMSAALAMPGPAIAAYMAASGRAKVTTRATVLILVAISYPIAFACQALAVGVPQDALSLSALLAPATLIGVALGRLAVPLISERVFRVVVVTVLCATALGLFASL
jgi:uncharacterized membrane protein YfcA